ncbi:MAG: hypothetical protein JNJ88_03615 [Planctomycetes bacterium]|nr:hypothetical protein [Planctomycetota bacterium]
MRSLAAPRWVLLGMALVLGALPLTACRSTSSHSCRRAAAEVLTWLEHTRLETPRGVAWAANPAAPQGPNRTLYSGSPGVLLFLLEHGVAEGDRRALELARRTADDLSATLPPRLEGEASGLYTGVAGVGCALLEAGRLLRDERYKSAARTCVGLLVESAKPVGAGIEWNGIHDVIAGSAGTGLFLLRASEALGRSDALELAHRTARRLVEVAVRERGGLRWPMSATYARNLPNFSHGTAGICYFLAVTAQATDDRALLDAAISGARYLCSVADRSDGGFRVFHADPDGLDRYYLSWCHGPAGTARLFRALHDATGDPEWLELEAAALHTILTSGLPRVRSSGFWNNVGQCCGSAGIAEMLLAQSRLRRLPGAHALAGELTADLLERATVDEHGRRWRHAEHRVKPELLSEQTGYAQGAAGIGLWLRRWICDLEDRRTAVSLPDDPYSDSYRSSRGKKPRSAP